MGASLGRVVRLARIVVDTLAARPRVVVGSLAAANVLATALFALAVSHNGWVWYQGGDQIAYATDGTLVAGGHLPPADLSWGWPFVLAPLSWATGPTYAQMLPALVVLQVLVLGPVALFCVYALATRVGGRLLGYWAGLLWLVAPYLSIPLFVGRYHGRYVDQILPQSLGLSALADYPSMVALLVCAVLCARTIERPTTVDATLAGLALGFVIALKPPNALFVAGGAAAFAVARRWRAAVVVAAATAPAVVALAVWKARGLGHLPLFSLGEVHTAAGAGGGLPVAALDLHRYLPFDWHRLGQQMDQLREFFWSPRLAQWLPVAGLLAVARRRPPLAALLAGWFAAFFFVKGSSDFASIESGSFWRLLMPAWPAYLLLVAAVPLLVPTLPQRLGARLAQPPAVSARRWVAGAAAVLLGLVPIVLVAVLRPLGSQDAKPAVIQQVGGNTLLTAADDGIEVTVRRQGQARLVTWRTPDYGPAVFYRVYRTANPRGDTRCESSGGAGRCFLVSDVIATTRSRQYLDASPPQHPAYRIGVATNYLDDPSGGDVFVVSPTVGG
jgi:hypothetical protein